MDEHTPIYNSRIIRVYLEFLKKKYPHIDRGHLLQYSNMTPYEVNDQGHWFSQNQVNRFQEILLKTTGNPNIYRESGRFTALSSDVSALRQYIQGFIGLATAYSFLGKFYRVMSRGALIQAKRLRSNKVQVTSIPKSGVREKPGQCENRMGTLESIALLFIGKLATIQHPECFHKGGSCCRYIVTWEKTRFAFWKIVRNYSFLFFIIAIPSLFILLPIFPWTLTSFAFALITIIIFLYVAHLEKKELIKTIQDQSNIASITLEEMTARYDNILFVQKISEIAATIQDVNKLIDTMTDIIEEHLIFDRGLVMLANPEKTRLTYVSGYGYNDQDKEVLQQTEFHLDKPDATGIFVKSYKRRKPVLADSIDEVGSGSRLSARSRKLAKKMGVKSIICVPIIYEDTSLGILAVDNVRTKRPLTQSDINLLQGVASQIALGIANARSFQKLQESEEKYRTVLENIEEGYFEVDLNGDFTFFNESLCKILRVGKNELIGVSYREYMDEKNTKKTYDTFNKVFWDRKSARMFDLEVIRKDGSTCNVEISVSLMIDEEQEPVGFRGIARDITERKIAEREKKRLEAQLHEAQKMEAVGALAGGVAHDLNNILSGIASYPELLLLDIPEDSPLRNPLLTIQSSGEKASAIVQDLLTLARRGVAALETINLNKVIMNYLDSPEYIKMKSYYPKIKVISQLEPNLFNISGSPFHLSKTIMNIMSNAAEAIQTSGEIAITTANCYIDTPIPGYDYIEKGDYVVLSVSDTGVGISPEDREKIFEPFYTKKAMGRSGTGLGMTVVWGTVKDHKGYIDVQSRVGKGTTFKLYFPITRMKMETEKSPIAIQDFMGHGESILIVDDADEQRDIAFRMMKRLGYSVTAVSSGEEALRYLKDHRCDLMILDMIMAPGIDGLETYRQALALHSGQKAIIVSGFSETDKVKEAQRLGAGSYIKKPYTIEKIGTAIRAELDK